MLGTLVRATAITLIIGSTLIWSNSGLPHQPWWQPNIVLTIVFSVLPGVTLILKRQGRRGIPAASIFIVVMFAALVYIDFAIAFRRGQVEL